MFRSKPVQEVIPCRTPMHSPRLCTCVTNAHDAVSCVCFFSQETCTNYKEWAAHWGRTPTQTQWRAGTVYVSGWLRLHNHNKCVLIFLRINGFRILCFKCSTCCQLPGAFWNSWHPVVEKCSQRSMHLSSRKEPEPNQTSSQTRPSSSTSQGKKKEEKASVSARKF